jgi:glycosyltransferase involved in cell wall biosynthesis
MERVTVRRFPTVVGPLRFPVAPKLRERFRLTSHTFDVVDVHTRHPSLALAVAGSRASRLVLTPEVPIAGFLGWSHARATRAIFAAASRIVCSSEVERDLLCRAVPSVVRRAEVVPDGVDVPALMAAEPFAISGSVVLAVDRLDRAAGVGRAIAALPSLDPDFRLVVVGDGPARERLSAFAADLRTASRVQFVGAVPDAVLYRWLRTARVVVSLASERSSGSLVTEAVAAGVSVVASDLPIHRRVAERLGGGHVIFVAPRGSPLDVADAIEEAVRPSVSTHAGLASYAVPSWESAVTSTWELYQALVEGSLEVERGRASAELVDLSAQLAGGARVFARPFGPLETRSESTPEDEYSIRMNGARRWP